MRNIEEIIVHCSATPPGMNIGVSKIREWHLDRGWSDVGYHYVIRRHGIIEIGRNLKLAGAHVRGHNKNSVGICLVGGVDGNGNAEVNYTDLQMLSLELLVGGLYYKFVEAFSDISVTGHNNWTNAKTCPNFDVPHWWQTREVLPVL